MSPVIVLREDPQSIGALSMVLEQDEDGRLTFYALEMMVYWFIELLSALAMEWWSGSLVSAPRFLLRSGSQ